MSTIPDIAIQVFALAFPQPQLLYASLSPTLIAATKFWWSVYNASRRDWLASANSQWASSWSRWSLWPVVSDCWPGETDQGPVYRTRAQSQEHYNTGGPESNLGQHNRKVNYSTGSTTKHRTGGARNGVWHLNLGVEPAEEQEGLCLFDGYNHWPASDRWRSITANHNADPTGELPTACHWTVWPRP